MNLKSEIRRILGSKTDDKSVHAQAILDLLNEADSTEQKVELLEVAFIERDKVEKSPEVLKNKGLEPDVYAECGRLLGNIANQHARNAFFSTENSKEFTEEILRFIDFQKKPEDQCYCLAIILYDTNIIPYHNLPGKPVRISYDEYKQLLLSHKESAELIGYLVNLPFFDWVEATSVLLQVIDDAKDPKLRIALLSYFMMAKMQSNQE